LCLLVRFVRFVRFALPTLYKDLFPFFAVEQCYLRFVFGWRRHRQRVQSLQARVQIQVQSPQVRAQIQAQARAQIQVRTWLLAPN
jgi:hypothetical protein